MEGQRNHAVALHWTLHGYILANAGKPDKLILEPLNFADDHVLYCYGQKGAIFKNWPDALSLNF